MQAAKTLCGINNASKNDMINTKTKELKSKFGIDDIAMNNYCLSNVYWWLPKMAKTPIKARLIYAYPNSLFKPLANTFTLEFRSFYKQIENYIDICRIFTEFNTFRVAGKNMSV